MRLYVYFCFVVLCLDCGLHLYNEPYPCFVIKDFITDTNFVCKLKNELSELKFFEKSNDLFQFQQVRSISVLFAM